MTYPPIIIVLLYLLLLAAPLHIHYAMLQIYKHYMPTLNSIVTSFCLLWSSFENILVIFQIFCKEVLWKYTIQSLKTAYSVLSSLFMRYTCKWQMRHPSRPPPSPRLSAALFSNKSVKWRAVTDVERTCGPTQLLFVAMKYDIYIDLSIIWKEILWKYTIQSLKTAYSVLSSLFMRYTCKWQMRHPSRPPPSPRLSAALFSNKSVKWRAVTDVERTCGPTQLLVVAMKYD